MPAALNQVVMIGENLPYDLWKEKEQQRIIWQFHFKKFREWCSQNCSSSQVQLDFCLTVLYKQSLNTHRGVLIFIIPKLWADCLFFFLFCRKHSTLMTGEVTRRSIQTLKQENRPKFGPLIKAGRPKKKKKSCDLQHHHCDRKTSWATRSTWDMKMSNPSQMKCGQGGTRAINADVR